MYSFLPSPMPFYLITRAHLAHSTHLSSPPLTATQTCTHPHSQTQLSITFPVTHIPSHHPHPSSASLILPVLSPTLSLSVLNHPTISLSTHLTTLSLPLTTHCSLHHLSSLSYLSSPSFSIMSSFLGHTHSTFLPRIYRPT